MYVCIYIAIIDHLGFPRDRYVTRTERNETSFHCSSSGAFDYLSQGTRQIPALKWLHF